ncbi:NAD-dependent epimerase/dehydratase family protein [Paraburkholderia sp. RL17-347-BIC-D]|uniref:NAD-dependent epimerase/dehydratase family protein n=1 Tax=Paraburkholderia sp. RL17-347-BIC-D TaxID=3031632 RepID=UPI0038BDFD92
MTIFITGASGFVGGTVARRLLAAGHSVRGLIRDASKAESLKALGIEPVIGSLEDSSLLTREAGQSEGVIHAADSDHRPAIEALIEGLRGSGKPLLHTSGSSVIGDDALGNSVAEAIFDENTPMVVEPVKQPRRDIELRVLAASGEGVRAVVICPSNIYGSGTGLNPRSVQIPFLVDNARKGGVVHIVGRGVNRWSNVHIEDVAELYLLALEKAPAGAFYFIENGEASFGEIGDAIARRLKLGPVESLSVEQATERWGKVHAHYTFGSNSRVRAKRAREELGWTPHHTSALAWVEQDMPL